MGRRFVLRHAGGSGDARGLGIDHLNNLAEIEEVAASPAEPSKSGILKGFIHLVKKDPISALRNIHSFVQTPVFDLRNLQALGVSLPTH